MAKLVGLFGVLALCLVIVDIIHGQHNGDAHRSLVHIAEFIFFFGFLCLLEIWAFRITIREFNANRWLVITVFALFSCLLGLLFFGLAGGSFHGDGGPIAFSFLLLYAISEIVLPVGLIAFVVVAISNRRKGVPILDHK